MKLLIAVAMVLAGSVIGAGQAQADWPPACADLPWYHPCHNEVWYNPGWSPIPQGGQWGPNGYEPCVYWKGCNP